MVRIGLCFEGLPLADQARLDHYIFQRLRQEAKHLRHLRGLSHLDGELERRSARRIPADELTVQLRLLEVPLEQQAQLVTSADPGRPSPQLANISVTGCAIHCADEDAPAVGTIVELEISAAGLALQTQARVIYVVPFKRFGSTGEHRQT